ncbi:MAG: FkbM family methyltransferase [Candidatus Peribacteraceae bacterium]|nr:FkbM family methyltransferase [Candidatus Peribacteraceae bacterium]
MKKLRLYAATMVRLMSTMRNWPLYLLNKWHLAKGDRIRYQLRNGTTLIARPYAIEGGALNDVWLDRSYEPNDKGIVFDWSKCTHIIDIGANIGTFMLYAAAKAPMAQIYTFEPEPSNHALVQENMQANHLEQRVHAFNAGVSATTGSLTLYVTGDTGGHSVFDYSHKGTPTTIFRSATS